MKQTKVVTILNQKGGVSKTTIVTNLSLFLADDKKSILLVDLDPQGNLSRFFNACDAPTVYDCMVKDTPFTDCIKSTSHKNINIVSANVMLSDAEFSLMASVGREGILSRLLKETKENGKYDYILVDTAPTLGVLTMNGIFASDSILIPCVCEPYSMDGLGVVMNVINKCKVVRPEINVAGIIISRYKKVNMHQQIEDALREMYKDLVWNTKIREAITISECSINGDALTAGNSYDDFAELEKEFKKKIK